MRGTQHTYGNRNKHPRAIAASIRAQIHKDTCIETVQQQHKKQKKSKEKERIPQQHTRIRKKETQEYQS